MKLTRDANGNYVNTPTNAATVNQVGTVVGSEANNAGEFVRGQEHL